MQQPPPYRLTQSQGLSNLKVSGNAHYPVWLTIGSRNDWPMLGSILAKATAAISPKELQAIQNKWLILEDTQKAQLKNFYFALMALECNHLHVADGTCQHGGGEFPGSPVGHTRSAMEHKPDAILMDINLARGMNGVEASHSIRHFPAVPIIFISGYTNENLIRQALTLQPAEYLVKPLSFHRLKVHLAELTP